ncbi:MAG: PepSY domain-containing protein [Marinobacterium sp.]|nr:PepSY domain-containing protein [Marinobacterium sp.]
MAMHPLRHTAASLALTALIITPGNTVAAAGPQSLQLSERTLSLQEAVSQARRQFGGKVIKAYPLHLKGRHVYRIRMMRPDGRVREVMLDAHSGKPLRRKNK